MAYSYTLAKTDMYCIGGLMTRAVIVVTPSAGDATGNVTVTELDGRTCIIDDAPSFTLTTDISATVALVQATIDSTTENKVNVKIWSAAGAAGTPLGTEKIRIPIRFY